ncbi:MAG: hypothetical protein P8P74_03585 [Crocinitomicaceae bacterium]|nr:hypothetical protein [Crocinitomicaceae bacterium]
MGLFGLFGSKKKQDKEHDFMAEMEAMVNGVREREGTTEEELPQGKGDFGFSANNPIPFADIAGSRKYLENLILIQPGASEYQWYRSGSVRSEIVSTPVDKYDLVDADNAIVKTIYIWPYNKVDSKKVPEGFGLME